VLDANGTEYSADRILLDDPSFPLATQQSGPAGFESTIRMAFEVPATFEVTGLIVGADIGDPGIKVSFGSALERVSWQLSVSTNLSAQGGRTATAGSGRACGRGQGECLRWVGQQRGEAEFGGADDGRVVAEARRAQPHPLPRHREDIDRYPGSYLRRRGRIEIAQHPAEDHHARVEQVDEIGHADAEPVPDAPHRFLRDRVASVGVVDHGPYRVAAELRIGPTAASSSARSPPQPRSNPRAAAARPPSYGLIIMWPTSQP